MKNRANPSERKLAAFLAASSVSRSSDPTYKSITCRDLDRIVSGEARGDAVREHVLPVDDLGRACEARVQAMPGDLVQELVACRHGVKQRAEFQVGG